VYSGRVGKKRRAEVLQRKRRQLGGRALDGIENGETLTDGGELDADIKRHQPHRAAAPGISASSQQRE